MSEKEVFKLRTGIAGFDLIAKGGLPLGRTTLVSGTAGSAKTIFSGQFLAPAELDRTQRLFTEPGSVVEGAG